MGQDSVHRGSLDLTARLKEVPVRMPFPTHEGTGSIDDLQEKIEDRVLARQG